MMVDFKRLIDLNAFEIVDVVPDGVNVVVCARWLFAWKKNKDGNIMKPKARLVARGFSQVHIANFSEHMPRLLLRLLVATDGSGGSLEIF